MISSFSQYRIFRKCPRKWFYKAIFADARSKDPLRHEAYILSKLQSIYAWRGQIVDYVLTNYIIPALNSGRRPTLREALKSAKELFNLQKAFGLRHGVREPEMCISKLGPEFAAFFKIEYGEPVMDADFDAAWADVERALRNVWSFAEMRERVRNAKYRIAQRNLIFDHCGGKIRAVPDMVVFFEDQPPLIVDWKVHTFGVHDYLDQLSTYAIALMRANPHMDFPSRSQSYKPHELELVEAQLLSASLRSYSLTEEDIHRTEERIAEGIVTLQLACDGKDTQELRAEEFPTAHDQRTCQTCPYRKICWNYTVMNTTATNVFRIEALESYLANYRLYRVRGLLPGDEDYYRNLNTLCSRLSRDTRSPVTSVVRGDDAFVVIREGAPEPSAQHRLVRAMAVLERGDEVFTLNFRDLTPDTRHIALRFLQFSLQDAFWRHHDLWQPHPGGTFFEKRPAHGGYTIGIHRGFLVRVIDLGEQGFGLCVDARHKYVSKRPLPVTLNRRAFGERYKTRHAIYHYGHEWYQIRLEELNDLTVTELQIPKDGKSLSLLEYVQVNSRKPLPSELAHLPKDTSVVHYYNGRDDMMAAPSALCYPVFDTNAPEVKREHGRTLLKPHIRHQMIEEFTHRYLSELRLDGKIFRLAQKAVEIPKRYFRVPDLKFGNEKVLSLNGARGAISATLSDFGDKRLELLRDKSAGFFVTDPLQQQFFFMPESIQQSWGERFLRDLTAAVDAFYPQANGYDPIVIPYKDSCGPTWVDQAQAVIAAASEHNARGGFAVVMLHQPGERRSRKEDPAAAFILRRLWEDFDIRGAVMHTDTGSGAYVLVHGRNGELEYVVRDNKRPKLEGYVRNVALNKVLLTNEKWPFVLAEPLHADVTIGVDLKAQHVGFTLVGQNGRYIDTLIKKTRFREHLRPEEFEKYFVEIIRRYHDRTGEFASIIVIHRDGRMFESELTGAHTGFKRLLDDGFVAPAASLTCVEIGKSSFTSLRLFDLVRRSGQRDLVQNPRIGQAFIPTANEGYLVTTGYPFDRQGTVLPLHVQKVDGTLGMEQILEDIFRLAMLTWSKPEDCTRYPITIKLNDRRLFEDAGEYDESEVELQEEVEQ